MVNLKAVILNSSVGKNRVIKIKCSHTEEQKVIKLLRKAGIDLDIRNCNWWVKEFSNGTVFFNCKLG